MVKSIANASFATLGTNFWVPFLKYGKGLAGQWLSGHVPCRSKGELVGLVPLEQRGRCNAARMARHCGFWHRGTRLLEVVHHAFVVLGPAGMGKTAVAAALCRWAASLDGHRVAVAMPTGLLRDHNITVETVASMSPGRE